MPEVLKGIGPAIFSTSKGVMTDKKARKEHVGGDIRTGDFDGPWYFSAMRITPCLPSSMT